MKKFFGFLAVAPFAALAAGESGAVAYEGSVADQIVDASSGTIIGFLNDTAFGQALVGALLAVFVISVSWVLLKFVNWAAGTGYGRYRRD